MLGSRQVHQSEYKFSKILIFIWKFKFYLWQQISVVFLDGAGRKELKEVISTLPKGASLDVFYLLGATQGMDYSAEQLRPFAQGQRINLQFFRMKPIYNHKKASIECHDGAWTSSYYSEHSCLWPERSVESAAEIKEYIDSNIRPYLKSDTYLFRYGHWTNDCGIFSSIDNRRIVELEFLKKGNKKFIAKLQ